MRCLAEHLDEIARQDSVRALNNYWHRYLKDSPWEPVPVEQLESWNWRDGLRCLFLPLFLLWRVLEAVLVGVRSVFRGREPSR